MKFFRIIPVLFLTSVFFFLAQVGSVSAKDPKTAKERIMAFNKQIVAASEKKDVQGAVTAAEKAYEVAKNELGDNALETANTMNNLANLYVLIGEAPAAEQLYKRAILIDIEKLDTNSTDMADIFFNLAVAYTMQKKYNDAINILDKTLAIRKKKLGLDDPATRKAKEMLDELTKLACPKTEKI